MLKTFAGWSYRAVTDPNTGEPVGYLWTSPDGTRYLVDQHGTTQLDT